MTETVFAVINETLRLFPSAPGFFRAAKEDTEVGGYRFKAEEGVFVLLLAVHGGPAWGQIGSKFDPKRFNPDRFAPSQTRGRGAEMFKPSGTRILSCIGRQSALHEMTLAHATLSLRFEITRDPGYEVVVDETLTLR